jgi:hypothetical protein
MNENFSMKEKLFIKKKRNYFIEKITQIKKKATKWCSCCKKKENSIKSATTFYNINNFVDMDSSELYDYDQYLTADDVSVFY